MAAPSLTRLVGCFVVGLGLLPGTIARAGDFQERLAAWQNGGRPVPRQMEQTAYVDETLPMPADAPQHSPEKAHYVAPGMRPPIAPGTPFASYGCDSCGTTGGSGCGVLCGGGCSFLNGQGCGTDGTCTGFGLFGPGCNNVCAGPLWWSKAELLLYWRQGRDYPPLVTTDPVFEDSSTAGILPDATVLFGGERETSQLQAGLRVDIGTWLDQGQCFGIGNRFFMLGKDSTRYQRNSDQNRVLAMPFFNDDLGMEDALLVAYPGLREGSIDISDSSEVFGNDLYAKILFCRTNSGRIDFITGYHFSRINDFMAIRSLTAVTEAGGNIPQGTTSRVVDRFDSRNEFHGGILGFGIEHDYCQWSIRSQWQVAMGNMQQTAKASGFNTISVPGQAPATGDGGLFTGPTNTGTITRDEFCVVPQVDLTLAYQWCPCVELTFGYSFMYWSDVARAGHLIDRVVSDGTASDRPLLAFDHGDFWVQGLTFGAACEF